MYPKYVFCVISKTVDTADLQQKVFNYLKEQKRCQNLMKMDTSHELSELVEEITISQPILVRLALAPPFDVCVSQHLLYYVTDKRCPT